MSAKFDDLAVKVERLSPLAPVASKLVALPKKVASLRATTFKSTEQVRALNLALIRVESAQRDGKAPVRKTAAQRPTSSTDHPNGVTRHRRRQNYISKTTTMLCTAMCMSGARRGNRCHRPCRTEIDQLTKVVDFQEFVGFKIRVRV